MSRTTILAAVAAAVVAAAGGATVAAASPMVIVYDDANAVSQLTQPGDGQRPLTPARGAFRQDPGVGGLFTGGGDERPHKIAKVSGRELSVLSAEEMAEVLRDAISRDEETSSHLVAVDEVTRDFGEPAPRHPRRGQRLAPVDPDSPGARLARAMEILDTPSPWGGTWASRVHLYIAPAIHSSIANGRGRERNLGRDGKPHLRTWRALSRAIAGSGGAWFEMYHHDRGHTTSFTAREWRTVPAAVTALVARHGSPAGRLHLLFTGAEGRPAGAPVSCGAPMACQWRLAESTPAGRAMLQAGPGAYRVGTQARDWLREFNQRFQ